MHKTSPTPLKSIHQSIGLLPERTLAYLSTGFATVLLLFLSSAVNAQPHNEATIRSFVPADVPAPTQSSVGIQRLAFDGPSMVLKFGALSAEHMNNRGRGLSLPGEPHDDSLFVNYLSGPNLASIYDRSSFNYYYSVAGESKTYCQTGNDLGVPGVKVWQAYSAFRPAALKTQPASTVFEMTFGLTDESVTRFRFANSFAALTDEFEPNEWDLLRLEISENALWVFPTSVTSMDASERVRLAYFPMTPAINPFLTSYRMQVAFDGQLDQKYSCSITLEPVTYWTPSLLNTERINLSPEYCDAYSSTATAVLGIEVTPVNTDDNKIDRASMCLSSMNVYSDGLLNRRVTR